MAHQHVVSLGVVGDELCPVALWAPYSQSHPCVAEGGGQAQCCHPGLSCSVGNVHIIIIVLPNHNHHHNHSNSTCKNETAQSALTICTDPHQNIIHSHLKEIADPFIRFSTFLGKFGSMEVGMVKSVKSGGRVPDGAGYFNQPVAQQ